MFAYHEKKPNVLYHRIWAITAFLLNNPLYCLWGTGVVNWVVGNRQHLCGTSLRGTSLHGTSLRGTPLRGPSLHGTSLLGSSLRGTSLRTYSLEQPLMVINVITNLVITNLHNLQLQAL